MMDATIIADKKTADEKTVELIRFWVWVSVLLGAKKLATKSMYARHITETDRLVVR